MPRELFILQPMCADRLSCKQCRDPLDDRYRIGWANIYQMPLGFPECPKGVPWGHEGAPAPVPDFLLGTLVDLPGSSEALQIEEQVKTRADKVRQICVNCPGGYYRGQDKTGLVVDCAAGYQCCGRPAVRGLVHLGCGDCLKGYWRMPPNESK